MAQGYTQVEGVNFNDSFAPVASLESIRILHSIACIMNFKLYQMDVKSAFFNGLLHEEMFVKQPKGFQDPHFPDHVLRLKKALYGVKQAPREWYDCLMSYLLQHGFKRGQANRTLFVKQDEKSLLAQEFLEEMKKEFKMSIVEELNYFLGLQVKQRKDEIFIPQEKYAKNSHKVIRFRLQETCIQSNEFLGKTELRSSRCGSRSNPLQEHDRQSSMSHYK